jgi:hypothetical protein
MPRRRDGWWGVAFVCGLAVVAALVSLPTAAESGERIRAFSLAHAQLIVAQQVLGVLVLIPFAGFVLALRRRSYGGTWLLIGAVMVGASQVATAAPPLVLAISHPSAATAHTLTLLADLADAALFASIALVSAAVGLSGTSWVRVLCLSVAAVTLARAVASPLGLTGLDVLAPIAFLAMVLVLSIRMLVTSPRSSAQP